MSEKWRSVDGADVLFGEVAGYVVCVARPGKRKRVGLSFCSPHDRAKWSRDKGVALALGRARNRKTSLPFVDHRSIEAYVTHATFELDHVPQDVSDSVRDNTRNLGQVAFKRTRRAVRQLLASRQVKQSQHDADVAVDIVDP